MIRIYPKTINIAIEALEDKIWFEENSSFPNANYIQRARMAISNLLDYEEEQKEKKEEDYMKT